MLGTHPFERNVGILFLDANHKGLSAGTFCTRFHHSAPCKKMDSLTRWGDRGATVVRVRNISKKSQHLSAPIASKKRGYPDVEKEEVSA